MSKQYGLTFPKKNLSAPKAGNIFGDDDDSDEEDGANTVKKALKAENNKNKVKKQVEIARKKALEQDPTIYQYDEVYDEMEQAKQKEEETQKKINKKPKYINDLLNAADQRKKEQELRKERIIQKEIEEEESKFPDKERFVTSGYKKKLEEQRQFEEEQRRKDSLSVTVTKQNDMSGFYRHLYRQTVDKNEKDVNMIKPEQTVSRVNLEIDPNIDKDDPIPSDSGSESDGENPKDVPADTIKKLKKDRQYRKRVCKESSSEDEEVETAVPEEKEEHAKISDTMENLKSSEKKRKSSDNEEIQSSKKSTDVIENQDIKTEKDSPSSVSVDVSEKTKEETLKPELQEKKKKINIWEKRTVGPVFEAALQRYLIRKQERLAGV